MTEPLHTLESVAPWVGLGLLVPIFAANALGVLDQSVAVRELAAIGVGAPRARLAMGAGRVVQLFGAPALFFAPTRPAVALVLAMFMVGATLTAHAFWRAQPADRDRQLASFLKNTAIVGALLLAAGWRS